MIKIKAWILVSGASSGIGLGITQVLSSNGFGVYTCARKKEDLDDLTKISNGISIKLDITNKNDIENHYQRF